MGARGAGREGKRASPGTDDLLPSPASVLLPPPPPGRLASSLLPALGVSRDPALAGEGNKTSKNKSRFPGASSTLKWAGGPYEVTVLFPLVSEDPLVEQRQLCSLGEAIPAFGGSSRGSQGNTADLQNSRTGLSQQGTCSRSSSGAPFHSGGKSQSPVEGSLSHQGGKGGEEVPMGEVKHVPWESFPQIMHVVASRRFSEHVLVKIQDSRLQDLGQAVIPIALGFSPGAKEFAASSIIPPFPVMKERVRVALSSGGVFKGMLTLDLSVTVQALLPQQKKGALGLAASMKKSKMTASGSAVLSGQKSGAGNGSSERELQTSASTGATRLTAEKVGSVHT
ncbi:hypothetical protein NGA_0460910 [Nannochloropsis gaditana CCMP526]|uniref:uncharacterized protein n=1 Tax=Nannochloropsis gaditana (strain CCMP526) TaxID=1093141 RepID=UPI00029F5E2F|nr:hypothetical protein NGA_0460910 [Nannochloropsis gaditana CCMP526]EKU22449.1 hypothetical protein NGA_0460910 [Nannochloropsis gaditana CCMP526]|eukprot:XP_005853914.1 hypothetical protein NGA_0460910 [Nannochloropsis gaditana CCMP526]